MSYFLVAVSTRENLELCRRYALAGFPDGRNGLWTYLDIAVGDVVSFLYGARVYDLYEVTRKAAYLHAQSLPPWPPLELRRTYHFAFRLHLRRIREISEPLVRSEFAYVAENLLLRGGYRKTHFQADQTTLQTMSEMGSLSTAGPEPLDHTGFDEFVPTLTRTTAEVDFPRTYFFNEMFLQVLTRRYLSVDDRLDEFVEAVSATELRPSDLEVLGEKGFPEGIVDLLIKESAPRGLSRKLLIEVKNRRSTEADLNQVVTYRRNVGEECVGGALIARGHPRKIQAEAIESGVRLISFECDFSRSPATFEELLSTFRLEYL